jgi:ABC-type branched-subunit amino acid transport system permease subunit
MGVKVHRVYAAAFAFGVSLAALAGALTAPKISMQPGLSSDVIILSFAIVVIGGLGSVEGAAVGAILVGLARATSVHLMPQAELFVIYHYYGGGADVSLRGPVQARHRETHLMGYGRDHPLFMILPVTAALLFGRVLPTWTLSLATIATSNALVALGIVVLARTGNVSFGQGLFFAAGGYGVALIANRWGITDAVLQMVIGAICGALLSLVIGPLIARYSGIFFGMLTLALSMVFYGALVKATLLGGSDGFNVGRPSVFGISFVDPREADFMLYAVAVTTAGLAATAAVILFRSEFGLASLAVRENNLRVEYLGISANCVVATNFVIAATFAGASGAFAVMAQRHIDPQFAYWTTSVEFVFVAVLAGYQSVLAVFVASLALELVRSFSNLYLPNTWQLALGIFLLAVILFLANGIGSLWTRKRRKTTEHSPAAPAPVEEGAPP